MESAFICTVVVDIPYNNGWSYLSKNFIAKGTLVNVNIGSRLVCGLVTQCEIYNTLCEKKLKYINQISSIILSPIWLNIVEFMANYYHEGLGETALFSLPKYIKDVNNWETIEDLLEIYYKLKPQHNLSSKSQSVNNLIKQLENYTQLKFLKNIHTQAKHYLCKWDNLLEKTLEIKGEVFNNDKPKLNLEQQNIFQEINQQSNFNVNLLHGITGSGKTEIYLNLIEEILSKNLSNQVLVLVPEINLTPQIFHLIQKRFKVSIAILHSNLSDKQRAKNWYLAHMGLAKIIIGTRLACLSSIPNLKCIIVDEEHDLSYKQQEGIRYNARDMAIFRAKQQNIPIILGSATPSLETYLKAKQHQYKLFTLNKRATNMQLPPVHLIDMKNFIQKQNLACISPIAINKIHETLAKKQQVLLFLNRRGFAPIIFCPACTHTFKCKFCSTHLVLHTSNNTLNCHHCGFKQSTPNNCPQCEHSQLMPLGFGTQRLEQTLKDNFVNYTTIRIDSDTIANKGELEKKLEIINSNEADIIIGTQILAKGHDFKNLGMVLVLEPDGMLYSSNIRAKEQLFAQLMQVIGRAGRHIAGNVYIQTICITEPLYQYLQKHDFDGYANLLLEERKEANYFPFSNEVQIHAGNVIPKQALLELKKLYTYIKNINLDLSLGCEIGKPIDHSMLKHSGIERAYFYIQNSNRKNLHILINYCTQFLKSFKSKWYIELLP